MLPGLRVNQPRGVSIFICLPLLYAEEMACLLHHDVRVDYKLWPVGAVEIVPSLEHMNSSKLPEHSLDVEGKILIRNGGSLNIGDGANVKIKSTELENSGTINISSLIKTHNLLAKLLIGVTTGIFVGFVLWIFGWN